MSDLISRQAAIDAFNTNLNELVVGGEENAKTVENYLNRVLDKIKCLPSALSTNLAEVGTDCISRQAAIDALKEAFNPSITNFVKAKMAIDALPPAQPDIIYCKDCVKHNKGLGNYEVHPDGSSTWIWKDSACPLVSWRDKAQGHEFDYQFCAYAKRREVTT